MPAQNRLKFVVPVLSILVGIGLTAFLLGLGYRYFGSISDAPEYYIVGRLITSGRGAQIYDAPVVLAERHKLFPAINRPDIAMLSPPPGAILFTPLGLLPQSYLQPLWTALSVLLVLASMELLRRAFALRLLAFLWVLAATFIFWPLYEALRIGQITPFLLFALSLSAFLFQEYRSSWSLLPLCLFVIKPHYMVALLAFLLGRKQFRPLFICACVVALLCLAAWLALGRHAYEGYLQFASHLDRLSHVMEPKITPTIRGQLIRLDIPDSVVWMVSRVALFVAFVLSYLLGVKARPEEKWLFVWLAGIFPLSMLTASLAHAYDMVFLIPGAVALVAMKYAAKLPSWIALIGMLAVIVMSIPVANELHVRIVLYPTPFNPFFFLLAAYSALSFWILWSYLSGLKKAES